jgi:prepilin-type N-terminal cleavage/methylation domain-containing protein
MKNISGSQAGFSLIELAIALVIIGVVVGAILLKGGDLIENARLKAVLSQVNEIRIAVATFQDRYNALPGDYDQASEHIKTSLINGQNDGIIGGKGLDPTSEAFNFWSHLAAASLISDPGKMNNGTPRFGQGAPTSRIGGGFTIKSTPQEDMPGVWIVLGSENGEEGNGALLTPLQAMHLDKRADDGDPLKGKIRALNGNKPDEQCLTEEGLYNTKLAKPACVVYFQLF